jgi:ribokinase
MPRLVTILGIYVVDVAFFAPRMPRIGETILGDDFKAGPGGKGGNQAVAAARAGARVAFVTRIGDDDFGRQARAAWTRDGIDARFVSASPTAPTGAAFIYVDSRTGDNAIIVAPGAANELAIADVEPALDALGRGDIFMTQLEAPLATTTAALEAAKRRGAVTILNPAPAAPLDDAVYRLCDYFTPNESEAAALAGFEVDGPEAAERAADLFLAKGVGTALITLGPAGVFLKSAGTAQLVPAFPVDKVVDTTGAGDAFNGGFAAALAEGAPVEKAVRFGCAVGALCVQARGTAPAMPSRAEIDRLIAGADA